jgi:hypothetical protein
MSEPEPLRIALARLVALHGLGTRDGSHRSCPPNEKWDQDEWERRILDCVPARVGIRCYKLADDLISMVKSGVWP